MSPTAGTDLQTLLFSVARGDQDAFARMCAEVSGPVYGAAMELLPDPAKSEELTRQVLIELWQTAPRYQPANGSARAWVISLVHHRLTASHTARTDHATR